MFAQKKKKQENWTVEESQINANKPLTPSKKVPKDIVLHCAIAKLIVYNTGPSFGFMCLLCLNDLEVSAKQLKKYK